jgi:hypothetical protein
VEEGDYDKGSVDPRKGGKTFAAYSSVVVGVLV